MAKDPKDISKDQLKALEASERVGKELQLTLRQIADLQDKILNGTIANTKELGKQIGIEKARRKEASGIEIAARKQAEELQRINELEEEIKKKEKDRKDLITDLSNQLVTQQQATKDLADRYADLSDLSAETVKKKQEEIAIQQKSIKAQLKGMDGRTKEAKILREQLGELDKQHAVYKDLAKLQDNKQAKAIAGAFESANDAVDKMQGNLEETFDKIPGGGVLGKMLGVDDFSKKMKGEVTKAFSAMNQEIAKGGGLMGALKTGMAGFNAIVMVNPLLLVVAAGAALFKILSKNEEMSREFAKNSGLDYANSQRIVESTRMRNTLSSETLATTEDILKVQEQTIAAQGLAGKLSNETASAVAETGMAFGYGAEKAGEVQATMMKLGASQQEAASAQKEIAAEAMKAGVNVGAVMDDVAKNSAAAARYMGGNVKEITKAALQAAKLGMTLDTMVNMADGLLNIEDSLTAQFEYQALSGKQINVDKARQLALEGDLAGMAEEVAKQAGTLADFNKMGRFEREKMAKAFGMDVGQMQEMLAMEEARKKIGPELAEQAAELGLTADEMANMSAEELQNKIAQKQQAASMSKTMSDIADTLTGLLLPVAQVLAEVFNMILKVVNLILWPFRKAYELLDGMGTSGQIVLQVIKYIGVAILAYMAYQKISNMLADRKARKELEAKDAAVQKNKIETEYAELQAKQSNTADQIVSKKQEEVNHSNELKANAEAITAEKQTQIDMADGVAETMSAEQEAADALLETEKDITKELETQADLSQQAADGAAAQQQKQHGGGGGGMLDKAKNFGSSLLGGGKSLLGKAGGMLKSGYDAVGGWKGIAGGAAGAAGLYTMMNQGDGGGFLGSIPGYATGGEVANTGIAKVHEGEMITPANKVPGSEPSGEGGGGAGIDYDKMTQAFIAAMKQMPAPQVSMDGKQISDSVSAQQSYNRGIY